MNHRTIRNLRTKLAYRIAPWLKPMPCGVVENCHMTGSSSDAITIVHRASS